MIHLIGDGQPFEIVPPFPQTENQKQAWADQINSFQNHTGFFAVPSATKVGCGAEPAPLEVGGPRLRPQSTAAHASRAPYPSGLHRFNPWHATGYATAALRLLGHYPRYNNTEYMALANDPAQWLPTFAPLINGTSKGCSTIWSCGHKIAAASLLGGPAACPCFSHTLKL